MYTRNKERTERMITKYFKNWYREVPDSSNPFNGIVKLNDNLPYYPNFNFTCGKKYYVVNGYILDNSGFAYGVYHGLENRLNEGMCIDFPAYPIETFIGLENDLFVVVEKDN